MVPFEWLISLRIGRIRHFSDNWPRSNRPSSQTDESFELKTEKNRTSYGSPQLFILKILKWIGDWPDNVNERVEARWGKVVSSLLHVNEFKYFHP